MLSKILNTFFTNVLLFISTFAYSILLARLFGVEGKGWANLFNTNIKITVLIAQFFGGSALVFLFSRLNHLKLFWIANSTGFALSFLATCVFYTMGYVQDWNILHLFLISWLTIIFQNNLMLLLGEEKVKAYNAFLMLQSFLLIGFLFSIHQYTQNLNAFIFSLYLSLVPPIAIQVYILFRKEELIKSEWSMTFNQLFKYGFMAQLSTLINYFNYRLAFYFISGFTLEGEKNVGIYAVSIAFCEAIWLLGRSIAMVFYARISNDPNQASKKAIQLFKINFFLTIIMSTALIVIPGDFYVFIFGNDVFEIVQVLNLILWPGIIGIGGTFVFSHYFAGKGKFEINVKGTFISLIISIAGGLTLIPRWGILGAAMTGSLAFTTLGIYFTYMFLRRTGTPFNFLSFTIGELWSLRKVLKK